VTGGPRSADVVVIGGGIHGCSTALHCALRGLSVALIEKDHAGRHASGVNAGGVRQLARHVAEIPLSNASMEIWHRIGELVDDDCGFTSDGQVMVAEDEADELRALVPAVSDTCPGGVISRRDGAAIPLRATQAFKRKAQGLGVAIHEGVRVTAVRRDGAAWRVVTDAGDFVAPRIVNAAGAWADRIAADLGEPVPLEPVALMLMITAPMAAFIRPVVILRGRKLSFKQFDNGTVLIGGGHTGTALRDENRTILDWRKLAASAATVWDLFPVMRGASIVRAWAGIEGRMPDDLPVLGPSARNEGVYHQFGFSAHGFQLGPAAGAVMAELIATGRSNVPIDGLGIARFSPAH
jgi:sarcosine oxidase subunit beta